MKELQFEIHHKLLLELYNILPLKDKLTQEWYMKFKMSGEGVDYGVDEVTIRNYVLEGFVRIIFVVNNDLTIEDITDRIKENVNLMSKIYYKMNENKVYSFK